MSNEAMAKNVSPAARSFRVGKKPYPGAARPYIMGILNVTPDSFADGGLYQQLDQAVAHGLEMAEQGADFIDVGGESSRPGANPVSLDEEAARVLPVIQKLATQINIPISIDTSKAEVARRALLSGARLINDISALRADPEMIKVALDFQATLVLLHMQGEPGTMQIRPHYKDVVREIHNFLEERITFARARGLEADQIIIDPGIGFGKRLGDNYEILRKLREFGDLAPILVGPSRKSFIGQVLNAPPGERLFGTAAAVAVATMNGAAILRVHDVREMRQVAEISYQCMTRSEPGD
ncbi:MAG TPA: dihydropteroate synthase [bacterium]|jgi:dihydropteroate synthase